MKIEEQNILLHLYEMNIISKW